LSSASPIRSERMNKIVIFEILALSSFPSADGLYMASASLCRPLVLRKKSLITRTIRSRRSRRPTYTEGRTN